jgi:hypothetical protein
MMLFILLIVLGFVNANNIDEKRCAAAGFVSDSLFCSTCLELKNFIDSDADLINECQSCCTDDVSEVEQVRIL